MQDIEKKSTSIKNLVQNRLKISSEPQINITKHSLSKKSRFKTNNSGFYNQNLSRSKLLQQNSTKYNLDEPLNNLKTPTMVKKLNSNSQARLEVAEAHATMSKASIEAEEITNNTNYLQQKKIKKQEPRVTFSRIPRTIERLLR